MIKVRFNLALGKHFMHWKVEENKQVIYYDPTTNFLVFYDCYLKNQNLVADSIFKGAYRQPCAWLCANKYEVKQVLPCPEEYGDSIFYNPKVAPYWRNSQQKNIDNSRFDRLITIGSKIYIAKEYSFQQLSLF